MWKGSFFSTYSSELIFLVFLIIDIFNKFKVILQYGFDLHFLMIIDVEHLLMYILIIDLCSFFSWIILLLFLLLSTMLHMKYQRSLIIILGCFESVTHKNFMSKNQESWVSIEFHGNRLSTDAMTFLQWQEKERKGNLQNETAHLRQSSTAAITLCRKCASVIKRLRIIVIYTWSKKIYY